MSANTLRARRSPRVPAPRPLFVEVGGAFLRIHEVQREPGDAARLIITLRDGDTGREVTCADCRDFLECDCSDYRRDGWECGHLRALLSAGVFLPPAGWTVGDEEGGGL